MGIIKNGILGGFSGKVGNLVGYKRLGKNIMQGKKKGGIGSINSQLLKMTYAMKLGKTLAYNCPQSLLDNIIEGGITRENFWKLTQTGFNFCTESQTFFPYDLAKISPDNHIVNPMSDFSVNNVTHQVSMRIAKVALEPDPAYTANLYVTIIQKNGSFISQTNRLNQTFNAAFSILIPAAYRNKKLVIMSVGKSNKTGLRGYIRAIEFTIL